MANHSVLFYETEQGEQPVRTYLDRMGRSGSVRELAAIERQIDRLVAFGARLPSLGGFAKTLVGMDGLCELKAGDHRVAYADVRGEFVLLHAWRKQGRRTPRNELLRAQRRLANWTVRVR